MNNININNIFSNSNNDINNNNNNIYNLSITNLIESNTFKNTLNDDFVINKIKNNKKNENEKIIELYNTKYKECLLKINNTIDANLTDTIFSVGNTYFGYKNYNSIECLKYIESKLKKRNFLTYIYSNRDIFISWKDIIDFLK